MRGERGGGRGGGRDGTGGGSSCVVGVNWR